MGLCNCLPESIVSLAVVVREEAASHYLVTLAKEIVGVGEVGIEILGIVVLVGFGGNILNVKTFVVINKLRPVVISIMTVVVAAPETALDGEVEEVVVVKINIETSPQTAAVVAVFVVVLLIDILVGEDIIFKNIFCDAVGFAVELVATLVDISAYEEIDLARTLVQEEVAAYTTLAADVGIYNAVETLHHVFLGNKIDDARSAFGVVFG